MARRSNRLADDLTGWSSRAIEVVGASADDPETPIHGPVTEEFLRQVWTFDLRFTCEDCCFFDPREGICVHGYPNELHRSRYFGPPLAGRRLMFCREFEML